MAAVGGRVVAQAGAPPATSPPGARQGTCERRFARCGGRGRPDLRRRSAPLRSLRAAAPRGPPPRSGGDPALGQGTAPGGGPALGQGPGPGGGPVEPPAVAAALGCRRREPGDLRGVGLEERSPLNPLSPELRNTRRLVGGS